MGIASKQQELSIDIRFPHLRRKEKDVERMSCFIVTSASSSEINESNDTSASNRPIS